MQLANFWQDVRRDLLDRDRIYLPRESMERFGVTEQQIRDGIESGSCDDKFRRLVRFEVERTQAMFAQGRALLPMLRPAVRRQVKLFGQGGEAILRAIVRQDYDTLSRRPRLSRWQKGRLVLAGLTAAVLAKFGMGSAPEAPGRSGLSEAPVGSDASDESDGASRGGPR